MPKYVIALIDGRQEPAPEKGRIARHLNATLSKHGLLPIYIDVSQPLPDALSMVDVAGVLSWFDGRVPNPSGLSIWLDAQSDTCGSSLPEVMIGDPGGQALWTRLGTNETDIAILHDGTSARLETAPEWFAKQELITIPPSRLIAPTLPDSAEPLATLKATDGTRRALGFQLKTRTWLSDKSVVAQDPRGPTIWSANPDRIVEASTGHGPRPVPDLAVFQGRRIALAILLADGWGQRSAATVQSSLGTAAHEFANDILGSDGPVVTFGWPDPKIQPGLEDRAAFDAGVAFADRSHVVPVPITASANGIEFQTSFSLRLSRSKAGALHATPQIIPPTLSFQHGEPAFGDASGLHKRNTAAAQGDIPWPSGPDTLVMRADDLLNFSAREAIKNARQVHSSSMRNAMDISRYAAWLAGAASTRLVRKTSNTWYIRDRGDLQTVRVDRAEEWALDAEKSKGVLGARRFGPSLFVTVDPAHDAPIMALTPRSDTDIVLTGQMIGIVEAGPTLANMSVAGCQTQISAVGHGHIIFRAMHRPEVTADSTLLAVTSVGNGKWRVVLPSAKSPKTLTFAVGCN
ncbi:hypothetical protein [Marivita sp. S0852]|uniref:hypothetical protein n=1 Tax=Marivita sp. S0852 TaxID=3373893 RepID=UPI003981BF49